VRRNPVPAVLVLVQVLFATLPISIKIALRELSSLSLAALRVGGAAILFWILHRAILGERIQSWGDHARLALYASLGVVANQLLYITALTLTTATAAQTLMTAGPAVTLLVAIALGRESATRRKWIGIGLAGAGALYLVGTDFGSGVGLGNLLVLMNVSAFSIYLVISRDLLQRYDPLTVITWVFLWSALALLPWGVPLALPELRGLSSTAWLAVAWTIVIPTVGGYYLNQWALRRTEASMVATYVYLQPIATAALAVPLLGEVVSPRLIPAAVLIFLGVAIMTRRRALPQRG
jgi:drug/metabolite transporter (DMT)-like permease